MKGTFIVKTESGSMYTITSTNLGNLQNFSREPGYLPFKMGSVIGSGDVEFSGLDKLGEKITSQDLVEGKSMFIIPLDLICPEDLPEGETSLTVSLFVGKGDGWWITSPIVSIERKEIE